MKYYQIDEIIELLNEAKEAGITGSNYCAFSTNDEKDLVVIIKTNSPEIPEAVEEITLTDGIDDECIADIPDDELPEWLRNRRVTPWPR